MRTIVPWITTLAATAPKKEPWLIVTLMAVLSHFTYFALIGVLIIAGMGVPIPEDIPLIISGYMCSPTESPILKVPRMVDADGDGDKETAVPRNIPKLHWMMVAGMFGVLLGDSIVFTIGRRGIEGNNFVARHLRKVMHSKRRERVELHFARHGNLTVFAGRFMPGFRSIVFAFAGMSKMSYPRFLLIDGIAAAISVPVFIYLGYYFADRFTKLTDWIDKVKHILGPILLAVAVIAIVFYFLRRRRGAAAAPPAAP